MEGKGREDLDNRVSGDLRAGIETAGRRRSSVGWKGYSTHLLNMDTKAAEKEESDR